MILVAIGANLPGPAGATPSDSARWAVAQLSALRGLGLAARSGWYLTDPVPPSDQPPYVNGVVRLEADEGTAEPDPAELLSRLHAIEAAGGRIRGALNAPRSLDLDIIGMGAEGGDVRAAPDPVLPHPRAHLRAFVLVPLLDVAPYWIHPVLRRSARELLAALGPQGIRPMSPP